MEVEAFEEKAWLSKIHSTVYLADMKVALAAGGGATGPG
jgi:hypothetical protein